MPPSPTLQIIIASTRPGRVGLPVARWFIERARDHGAFELDVVDLLELDLPFMDEPNHPKLGKYTKDHTKQWSARVAAADAFVFVMPEYNFGFNAPLKNALDFLNQEWAYKPVGFVAYGGIGAGQRAVNMLAPSLVPLRLAPAFERVIIPFVRDKIDDNGELVADDSLERSATAMLDELVASESALRARRE